MIEARHVLDQDEIVAGTHFDDGIAAGNYDIDIHSPDGSGTSHYYFPAGVYYTIPYRSLLPKDFDNLVVAGRCIGATHEAQASIRIMPICICIGEAAGTAAALAKKAGVAAAGVDTDALRARLREKSAFVGQRTKSTSGSPKAPAPSRGRFVPCRRSCSKRFSSRTTQTPNLSES